MLAAVVPEGSGAGRGACRATRYTATGNLTVSQSKPLDSSPVPYPPPSVLALLCQPRSSETAAIQAEYKAVDAREKAKKNAEEAQCRRGLAKIKLAPASTDLRMPSEE